MTSTEPSTPARSKRSPGVVIAIVVVVVIALAGGAFLVYRVTKTKDEPEAVIKVAKNVTAAVGASDDGVLRSNSTGEGTTQLLALKPNDVDGMTLTAASCTVFGAKEPTRICIASRPGGQLQLRLVFNDNAWKVDLATLGAAGLPPTSSTSSTT